jgi:hypothetical protein
MTIPARIDRNSGRVLALAVLPARVLDDAHMTWIAAEVESEYALHAWFHAGVRQRAGAYQTYRAAVDREEAAARDLQHLYALTQPCQEHLARSK